MEKRDLYIDLTTLYLGAIMNHLSSNAFKIAPQSLVSSMPTGMAKVLYSEFTKRGKHRFFSMLLANIYSRIPPTAMDKDWNLFLRLFFSEMYWELLGKRLIYIGGTAEKIKETMEELGWKTFLSQFKTVTISLFNQKVNELMEIYTQLYELYLQNEEQIKKEEYPPEFENLIEELVKIVHHVVYGAFVYARQSFWLLLSKGRLAAGPTKKGAHDEEQEFSSEFNSGEISYEEGDTKLLRKMSFEVYQEKKTYENLINSISYQLQQAINIIDNNSYEVIRGVIQPDFSESELRGKVSATRLRGIAANIKAGGEGAIIIQNQLLKLFFLAEKLPIVLYLLETFYSASEEGVRASIEELSDKVEEIMTKDPTLTFEQALKIVIRGAEGEKVLNKQALDKIDEITEKIVEMLKKPGAAFREGKPRPGDAVVLAKIYSEISAETLKPYPVMFNSYLSDSKYGTYITPDLRTYLEAVYKNIETEWKNVSPEFVKLYKETLLPYLENDIILRIDATAEANILHNAVIMATTGLLAKYVADKLADAMAAKKGTLEKKPRVKVLHHYLKVVIDRHLNKEEILAKYKQISYKTRKFAV
mgnify:CR=1 FL=1